MSSCIQEALLVSRDNEKNHELPNKHNPFARMTFPPEIRPFPTGEFGYPCVRTVHPSGQPGPGSMLLTKTFLPDLRHKLCRPSTKRPFFLLSTHLTRGDITARRGVAIVEPAATVADGATMRPNCQGNRIFYYSPQCAMHARDGRTRRKTPCAFRPSSRPSF